MTPLQESPVREGVRHGLLTGLGMVLTLLLALGVYAAQSLSTVSRAGTFTTREYFERSERLEAVNLLLSAATGAVRDYLLDPDPSVQAVHRDDARHAWEEMRGALLDYKKAAYVQQKSLINRLDSELNRYWSAAAGTLEIAGQRRPESANKVLIEELVPLRDRCLATVSEIGIQNRMDLRAEAATAATFVQGVERRLWAAIAVTMLLSLLVAGTTFRYLTRLEATTLMQYEASVKTGIELENLSRRLLTLQEDERRRIARELHDDIGQQLASLLFEMSAAGDRPDLPGEMRGLIGEMEDRLRNVAKDLQQLSRSLHSAVLEKIGLEAAIASDCTALRQRTTVGVDFSADGVPKRLPEPLNLALYRVFQESVQNAIKHSGSTRLSVSLDARDSYLVLRVQDYGQGFDADSADRSGSLGLVSMRERLRMVGGGLSIRSEPGSGTQVEARVPLP